MTKVLGWVGRWSIETPIYSLAIWGGLTAVTGPHASCCISTDASPAAGPAASLPPRGGRCASQGGDPGAPTSAVNSSSSWRRRGGCRPRSRPGFTTVRVCDQAGLASAAMGCVGAGVVRRSGLASVVGRWRLAATALGGKTPGNRRPLRVRAWSARTMPNDSRARMAPRPAARRNNPDYPGRLS